MNGWDKDGLVIERKRAHKPVHAGILAWFDL